MIEFFDREPIITEVIEYEDKNGDTKTKTVTGPCQCPTFEKYCADTGISKQTFHNWTREHPEFLDAYQRSKNMQANIMMVNGLSGAYNSGFTGLSMKNMHGWSDKQEIENTHNVVQMPSVQLNGTDLEFDIGEDVKKLEDLEKYE